MISDLDVGQQITYPAYPKHVNQRYMVNNIKKRILIRFRLGLRCIYLFNNLNISLIICVSLHLKAFQLLVLKVTSVCLALVVSLLLLTLKTGLKYENG